MLPSIRSATLCLLACMLSTPVPAQDAREAVIAYVAPVEDPNALGGVNAARMAIDEINASQPPGAIRLRLTVHNDKADVRVAQHIANYITKTEAVAVIGHWTSTTSIAVGPIYTAAGMPQLAPISWSSLFSALPGNNHFQGVGSDDNAMRHTLDYLTDRLSLKKVMVIDDRAVLGVAMANSFEKYARIAGIEVLRQSVSTQTSDFNQPLLLARQAQPDLILFTGRGTQSAVIVRNLKRLGINAKLLLTGPVVAAEFLQQTGHTDEDLYAIVPGLPKENGGRMEAFRKRYVDMFDREPAPFAMFAYDCTYIMAAAIRRAGTADRQRVMAALHEVSHHGLMQPMAFNPDGTLKNPVFTLYQVERGRWVVRKLIKVAN